MAQVACAARHDGGNEHLTSDQFAAAARDVLDDAGDFVTEHERQLVLRANGAGVEANIGVAQAATRDADEGLAVPKGRQ